MRFHLDEHVDPAIAHGLRLRGIDVTTTSDAELLSAPDEPQLEFARREGRVIFTNDADFLRFASTGIIHTGIAYCSRSARSIGFVVRYLCLMHDCLEADEMRGKVEYLYAVNGCEAMPRYENKIIHGRPAIPSLA